MLKKHTGCIGFLCLQQMIMRDDILVASIFQEKSSGDCSKRNEAQFFVQGQRCCIGTYDGIKLQDTKAKLFCCFRQCLTSASPIF